MFGLIADLISSVTTILLPAYLSYKALRSHDPAQSHPWLIYFTILSLALLFESWTLFIIGWIPFYSWFRLLFLLYLVLPQTQGAKLLYLNYLEPYIIDHETRIDNFITETHQWLQQMGLGYFHTVIEYFRAKILGQENPQQPQSAQGYASYAQDLLARFAMPAARGPAGGAGIYGMVSGLTGAMAAGRSRDPTSEAASIPDSLARDQTHGGGAEQKSKAIAAQRERLSQILRELEVEQQSIDLAYGSRPAQHLSTSGLKTKSKSEQSFENLSYDDASGSETVPPKKVTDRRSTSGSGSWMPAGVSGWWAGEAATEKKESSKGRSSAKDMVDAIAEGSTTGYDRER